MLQVPLTLPVVTGEVREPVKVPKVIPPDEVVTLQSVEVNCQEPCGDICKESRLPLNEIVQLLFGLSVTAEVDCPYAISTSIIPVSAVSPRISALWPCFNSLRNQAWFHFICEFLPISITGFAVFHVSAKLLQAGATFDYTTANLCLGRGQGVIEAGFGFSVSP